MMKTVHTLLLASALTVSLSAPAWSAGLLDSIKDQAASSLGGGSSTASQSTSSLGSLGSLGSSLGLPSISGDTAGNAAGVLQYCIQNKYLGGSDATSVKEKLLDKVGLGTQKEQQQDTGYQQGLSGLLTGGDGSTFDLGKLKSDLKDKACSYVLDNASSLL